MSRPNSFFREFISKAIILAKIFYSEYKIRKAKSNFWQDKLSRWSTILALVFNFLIWIFIGWCFFSKEGIIPLHYNVYFGVDLVGNRSQIFKLPLIGIFVFIVNLILSLTIYKEEKVASYILLFVSLFCQVILLVASLLILNI